MSEQCEHCEQWRNAMRLAIYSNDGEKICEFTPEETLAIIDILLERHLEGLIQEVLASLAEDSETSAGTEADQ